MTIDNIFYKKVVKRLVWYCQTTYLCIVVSSHSGFNVRKDNKYKEIFFKKKIFEIKKRTERYSHS